MQNWSLRRQRSSARSVGANDWTDYKDVHSTTKVKNRAVRSWKNEESLRGMDKKIISQNIKIDRWGWRRTKINVRNIQHRRCKQFSYLINLKANDLKS